MAEFPPVHVRTNTDLDTSSKKILYSSRIYLKLTYCILVWENSSLTALEPLVTTHKQTIR